MSIYGIYAIHERNRILKRNFTSATAKTLSGVWVWICGVRDFYTSIEFLEPHHLPLLRNAFLSFKRMITCYIFSL